MSGPVVTVEGGRELRRTLRQAGDDLSDMKAAHQAAANVVVPRARSLAPYATGRLESTVRGSGTKTAALIRAGFASVPYAGVQEWGWPARHVPATHFVVLAAEATEPTWYDLYAQAVDAALAKVRGV